MKIEKQLWKSFVAVAVVLNLLLATGAAPPPSPPPSPLLQGGDEEGEAVAIQIEPVSAGDLSEVAALSAEETEALRMKLLELRESLAAEANVESAGGEDVQSDVPETALAESPPESAYPGPPGNLVVGNKKRNPRATQVSSLLAEPAMTNQGKQILYMGNTHQEWSLNNGKAYTNIPIPTGPADAPFVIGDPDIIHDQARAVTFRSLLYVNAGVTNGVVRIWVRRRIDLADSCSYDIDPAGGANNLVPDYPHLGVTNDSLWLTVNNVGAGGWNSRVYRLNIDQMADCVSTGGGVWTYNTPPQRVFVPAMSTREIMYWGQLVTNTQFRLYWWPESGGTIFSTTANINTSNFANPDCRGGVGDNDWIEFSPLYSILGFSIRGTVGPGDGTDHIHFYWNVSPDGSHPQAHVHGVVFREWDKAVIAQPVIWNPDFCFGYPSVAANERGDVGLTIGAGGQAGGGGPAVQGYVGIDDEFTAGIGTFGTVFLTAAGTHNPSNGRFGDYFTIRQHEPCDLFFMATNYALLNGNTSSQHVNARAVQFGRGRDEQCWRSWTWAKAFYP